MKRIFATLEFRWFLCMLIQMPYMVYASTTHDANDDGRVTVTDFANMQLCFTESLPGACSLHDFDDDDDLDGDDFDDFADDLTAPAWFPLPDAPPESAGYPRPWEGAINVSPYSIYNPANGNLLTVVPITSWDPIGPPVEFLLYHNSASAKAGESGADGQGFDLGDGWSTSYSGRVVAVTGQATVIEDDGTQNVFTDVDSVYVPPTGVYDKLEYVSEGAVNTWVLTRPSQTQRVYNDDGLLITVRDSSGNEVTIVRDAANNDRITSVQSAVHGLTGVGSNELEFDYDGGAQPKFITDPMTILDGATTVERIWTFVYDGANRLGEVINPTDGVYITDATKEMFTYVAANNDMIATATRWNSSSWEMTWTYVYINGRLSYVVDPTHPNITGDVYQAFSALVLETDDCCWRRTYTDRRGNAWEYDYDDETARGRLLIAARDPLDNDQQVKYDNNLNVIQLTNEMGKTWTATYGPIGNVESVTGPSVPVHGLATAQPQTWDYTWEAVGGAGTNHYRVTKIEDPADKWVEYQYAEPNDPTLVTQIIEMPDGMGEPNAITNLSYYWDPANGVGGLLEEVVDHNGVSTKYTYDAHGYRESFQEGFKADPPPPTGHRSVMWGNIVYNGAGIPTELDPPRIYANPCAVNHDINGNPRGGDGNGDGGDGPGRLGDPGSPSQGDVGFPSSVVGGSSLLGRGSFPTYNELGQLTGLSLSMDNYGTNLSEQFENYRDYHTVYDTLGRPTLVSIYSEPATITRAFDYDAYDKNSNLTQYRGPDDNPVIVTYDELNRVESVLRDDMSTTMHYDAAGRVDWVDYGDDGNGAGVSMIDYDYDDANKITRIRHIANSSVLLQIDYTWTINDWVASRTETDNTGATSTQAVTTFAYDNRGRLIGEERVIDASATLYDFEYTYDQLGNRLTKVDNATGYVTVYTYDVHLDPAATDDVMFYPTHNNRLLEYKLYDGDPNDPVTPGALLRTVDYFYYEDGNASNIMIKDEDPDPDPVSGADPAYDVTKDLALYYNYDGSLRIALWDSWKWDNGVFNGDIDMDNTYTRECAHEFRYDGPTQRYLDAFYDSTTLDNEPNNAPLWSPEQTVDWSDYAGDKIYNDFEVEREEDTQNPGEYIFTATETKHYLGRAAEQAIDGAGDPNEVSYYHGDLIGSTMMTTDEFGAPTTYNQGATTVKTAAYTAFGESIVPLGAADPNFVGPPAPSDFPRYQYAGAHGYESGLLTLYGVNPDLPPITLQHLGHRWYQPDIGRFVQRDPIGIYGGTNVYVYCQNSPLLLVDPDGLYEILEKGPGWARGIINVTGGVNTDWPGILDGGIDNVVNSKGAGAVGAGVTAAQYYNYKNLVRGRARPLNLLSACLAGFFIGWNAGKGVMAGIDNAIKNTNSGKGITVPGFCFVENTLVATTEGLIPISSVSPGDLVLLDDSVSEDFAKVRAVIVGHARELVAILLPQESLLCTFDHPFFVFVRGWIKAAELDRDCRLIARDGSLIRIEAVHKIVTETPVTVYTLDVDAPDVFYVGATGVRVHNKMIHY